MTKAINPMLEKVALALGEAIVAKSREPAGRSEIITANDCRDLARAAVQALMEPDEAMVERGVASLPKPVRSVTTLIPVYVAMLQTILEEN